ncbi:MAG: sensor histidine kinase [Bryobacteraceae bacterium]
MRTRAGLVLSMVALAQVILLGSTLGSLVLKLRDIQANLVRLGNEEQRFLNQLNDAESDLYKTSILLRDNIILDGLEQERARNELKVLLDRTSVQSLESPAWLSPDERRQVETVESTRREYLSRAQTVLAWKEKDRRNLGPLFLSHQLAPMREQFATTARDIVDLVRSLRHSRNQAMADSVEGIQILMIRILVGSVLLGLLLASVAVWRFRAYERERDVHIEQLTKAEGGLRNLSQRLLESQEHERKRLSRELHDEVGQLLTALRVQVGQIESSAESRKHVELAAELADRSLRSVREMARGLRPSMLDDLGLVPAVKWLGRDVSKNTDLDVEVEAEGEFLDLDESRRTCIYRVVQEALTNCVKHARSPSARVLLHESPHELVLTVQDKGVGFKPGPSRGVGLLGMRERVEELGGEFAVVSSPGVGTLIRANLPKARIEKA